MDSECPICYDDINDLLHNTAFCHKYHTTCIEKWFKTSNSKLCPVCKRTLISEPGCNCSICQYLTFGSFLKTTSDATSDTKNNKKYYDKYVEYRDKYNEQIRCKNKYGVKNNDIVTPKALY